MTEERKHEIEDIIDNALTEEDCKAWAEGNLTNNVKQLMEEHHIKQLNIWDDVCEIVEFDSQEKTYKYKAYFENKTCPVAVGAIDAESKEEAEKILFGISGSWTDESGNVFDAGCPVDVEVEAAENPVQILRKKIKAEYQKIFDRGVQTRKFNPDYDQELISHNFGNEDDRTEKQEKELFFFYAGYNAESLRR